MNICRFIQLGSLAFFFSSCVAMYIVLFRALLASHASQISWV
jgi:hypothetical protein